MDVQKDFADLCSLLNAQSVDFLIVGGYAVAFHGAGRTPVQIHLMTRITGVGWEEAWLSRTRGAYGSVQYSS